MPTRTAEILAEDLAVVIDGVIGWKKLSGETVLVTGAGGFLGSYLVKTLLTLNRTGLLNRPVSVVAGVRSAGSGKGRLANLDDHEHLSFLELDLSEISIPELPDAGYVIHVASNASPRFYRTDPVGTLLPNTVGTASLLQAGAERLKGFLFISSSEIYGTAGGEGQLVETTAGTLDCAEPRSCYGEGKRAGEALCIAWHSQHGVPAVIARLFHTYGPGLTEDDGRVFADFVHNALRGENIHIRGDGLARRAFCYVSDAISGLFTILLHGEPGEAYNVANPEAELSISDLAELIVSVAPTPGLAVTVAEGSHREGYMPSPLQRLLPNTEKLASLGWKARVSPREGFTRTIEAQL